MVRNISKTDRLVGLGKNVAGVTGNDASGISFHPAQPQGSMRPSLEDQ